MRRGDAAMQAECPSCINGDDPDVVDKLERISVSGMRKSLRCVNESLHTIQQATRRDLFAFVASDTAEGLAMAKEELGEQRVLSVAGAAVHSTRGRAVGESDEAVKVVADFICLALADVHFGLGDSSFLGNAASAGMGIVARVGDRVKSGNVCKELTKAEIEALSSQSDPPGPAAGREQAPKGHVEL